MKVYDESEYLQLAGIQHFAFCRRQWALIHLEQEWAENIKTIEGNILHENAHDDNYIEKRGNLLVTRGLQVSSKELGIYGVCDIVEFHKDDEGSALLHYDGLWLPKPVEYKKGKPKVNDEDRLQLCAQVICLEEVFQCHIKEAALYYDEVKHREAIEINRLLRDKLVGIVDEMHHCYDNRHTPKVKGKKCCKSCSLYDICMPFLNDHHDVNAYIKKFIEEKN